MKKTFLIILMALISFWISGCGESEEDAYDFWLFPTTNTPVMPTASGTATSTTTTNVTLSQNFLIPSPALALSSIRMATYWKEFFLNVNNIEFGPSTYSVNSAVSPSIVTLFFSKTFTKTQLGSSWNETAKTVSNIKLVEGGQPILIINSTLANDQASSSSGIPVAKTSVFTLSPDLTTGGLIVAVSSGTASATSLILTGSDTLFIESIYYTKSGQLATLSADVTDVPAPLATFTLLFNTLIANATNSWTFEVTNLDTNKTISLNSVSDANLFQTGTTTNNSRSVLRIGLTGNGKTLKTNTNYKVKMTATSIVRADKPTVRFTTTVTRTFKTGSS